MLGPQGKRVNGSGFGDSYGNGEPWALPTANKTFTYFITAVENKYVEDPADYEGTLMKDSYTPSVLCDAIVGDTFIVSKGGGITYRVYRYDGRGNHSIYTYQPVSQYDDQLALSSQYLKAVRIL